jgi:hypothetical protein
LRFAFRPKTNRKEYQHFWKNESRVLRAGNADTFRACCAVGGFRGWKIGSTECIAKLGIEGEPET